MPSLPFLVAWLIEKARNSNKSVENVDEDVQDELQHSESRDHRIDIQEVDNSEPTRVPSSQETKVSSPSPHRKRRRRRDSLSVAGKVAKDTAGHVGRFFFASDKSLDEGYSPKYRWLPIISGLLVPFSILLEVPGLTEHWYNRTDGTQVIEYRENPAILNAGLGLSMASALLANICLLMRFLERRIKSATIATIVFLLIHDVINIAALVIFGIIHSVDDGFTYSQAYWVTMASTITSLTVTMTLLIDYVRTPNFSSSGSGLTRKQRSLVIIVMVLLTYLGLGALIYCFLIDLRFLDALYFVCCSSLTIGFGDISPTSSGSRLFSIFYNTFGILNTGLAIAIARETIVESFEQSYRNRKHALTARRRLHRQLHAKKHNAKHGMWLATHKVNQQLPEGVDVPLSSHPPTPPPEVQEHNQSELGASEEVEYQQGTSASARRQWSGPRLQTSRHDTETSVAVAQTPEGHTHTSKEAEKEVDKNRRMAQEQVDKVDDRMVQGFDEEEREYIKFRQDMIKEEKKEFRVKLGVSWSLFVIFWVIGGAIFMGTEGWSYGTSIYFCFTAFSTIGYGDVAPRTGPGRVCFVAWSLMGVAAMTILFSVLSEAYQSRYSTVMHNGLFDKAVRSYQNKTHTEKQTSLPSTPAFDAETMTKQEKVEALNSTKVEMSTIPPRIISLAKAFHSHLQYVLSHNSQEKPPPGLQRALDELMQEEAMNEDLRKEVLQDGEARRTLFMMSFERTLKKMVENAERISKLIDDRDALEQTMRFIDEEVDELLNEVGDRGGDGDDDGTNDNGLTDSPAEMRHEDMHGGHKIAKMRWQKIRTGVLGTGVLGFGRSRSSRHDPYMHHDGSQSAPHLTGGEAEEAEDDNTGWLQGRGASFSNKRRRRSRARSSKMSNVRFADDPYHEGTSRRE